MHISTLQFLFLLREFEVKETQKVETLALQQTHNKLRFKKKLKEKEHVVVAASWRKIKTLLRRIRRKEEEEEAAKQFWHLSKSRNTFFFSKTLTVETG